jgi:hypothetical protein
MCAPDNLQLDCSPTISTPPHVPRAPRTRIHVARTRLLTTSTTPSSGKKPQHNAGLHTQQLAKPTRSHAQHHAATTTTTTTTKLQRERAPPARAPPVPQQRGRHQHEAPRNPSNTRQRSQSSEARQLTNCVRADVRQSRPIHTATTRRRVVAVPVVVPRTPSRRTPITRAAKAPISDFNHRNKRRNNENNTRRRQRSLNNTKVLIVLVVFLGGVSRES